MGMTKICKCCGETMEEQDVTNPNMCSVCAALLDAGQNPPGASAPEGTKDPRKSRRHANGPEFDRSTA
jgi:hypothetical protein